MRLLLMGLFWVGLTVVITLVGWLMVRGCGIGLPGRPPFLAWCEAAEARPADETRALRAELSRLERRLSLAPNCPACPTLRTDRVLLMMDASSSMAGGRLNAAKTALTRLVDEADPEVTFDFVTFSRCGPPRQRGHYAPDARTDLKAAINGVSVRDETALSHAVIALYDLLEDRRDSDEPVNVVLVSDGEDSCRANPCASARRLAEAFPNLRVNVIGLGDSRAAQCVAQATGGQFYPGAADPERLARLVGQAAGQRVPTYCQGG